MSKLLNALAQACKIRINAIFCFLSCRRWKTNQRNKKHKKLIDSNYVLIIPTIYLQHKMYNMYNTIHLEFAKQLKMPLHLI